MEQELNTVRLLVLTGLVSILRKHLAWFGVLCDATGPQQNVTPLFYTPKMTIILYINIEEMFHE